ncbi:hypothetical protein [Silvanigrella sp.]|jgi:hypothetical protein|uniref:hypothetical protein n=1 Tax=Silvanigrella sp. TaxID=2024976 RepID=UPI0037CBCC21
MSILLNKLWINKIIRSLLLLIIPIFLISCDSKGPSNMTEKNSNNILDEIVIPLPIECE